MDMNEQNNWNNVPSNNMDQNNNNDKGGKKDHNKFLVAVIIVLCMALAGVTGAGATYITMRNNTPGISTAKNDESSESKEEKKEQAPKIGQTEIISGLSDAGTSDLSKVYDSVIPSIVAITCQSTENVNTFFGTYSQDVTGAGSGVIFDEDDKNLYILTNNHVVDGAKSISIKFSDDKTAEGEVKGTAAYSDLAVVQVKLSDMDESTKKAIKIATLGNSDSLKTGEMVMAIGNALGYGQSLTVGYISATDREVTIDDISLDLIQTDAAINPGNSGGALINIKGEVIGINSAKLSDKDVEGMGYALPMNTAKPLAEQLKTSEPVDEENRGYLGIYYAVVDDATHNAYNIPYGLYVSDVADDGGAKAAGIQKGDVITKVDGYAAKSSNAINSIIANKRQGDKVNVTLERYDNGDYNEMEIEVTLAKKPEAKTQISGNHEDSDHDESHDSDEYHDSDNDHDSSENNDSDHDNYNGFGDDFNRFFFGW